MLYHPVFPDGAFNTGFECMVTAVLRDDNYTNWPLVNLQQVQHVCCCTYQNCVEALGVLAT